MPPDVLLIVARHSARLYDYARTTFAELNEDGIEVLLDRRVGERRGTARSLSIEQRRGDRRQNAIDRELQSQGWVLVRRSTLA